MSSCRPVRDSHRVLSLVATLLVMAGLLAHQSQNLSQPTLSVPSATKPHDWPMLGRTPARMPVHLQTGKLRETWDIKTGKNVKWSVEVGTQAYGGPVIAQASKVPDSL